MGGCSSCCAEVEKVDEAPMRELTALMERVVELYHGSHFLVLVTATGEVLCVLALPQRFVVQQSTGQHSPAQVS